MACGNSHALLLTEVQHQSVEGILVGAHRGARGSGTTNPLYTLLQRLSGAETSGVDQAALACLGILELHKPH